MRHLYRGLSLLEQLWLRSIALHPMITPLREQAWSDLTAWEGHRRCRTALAALVSPFFNPASPLHEQSRAYVADEWRQNPLLRASILYHLAMSSQSEFAVQRQLLEDRVGFFLTEEDAPLAKPGPWQATRPWDHIVATLAQQTDGERIHWEDAPSSEQAERYDAIRQVQEDPSAEQAVRRLADIITCTNRYRPAFAYRIAQACCVHGNAGNDAANERLAAALTYRLGQEDDGGLCHGLFTYLTEDESSNHGWVPSLRTGDDRSYRNPDVGVYRVAEIIATTPLTDAPWQVLLTTGLVREQQRHHYWLSLLVPPVLTHCPVSTTRTNFVARCYAAVGSADYHDLPEGYKRERLYEGMSLHEMVSGGNPAEAVRVVLAIDQYTDRYRHSSDGRDSLAEQLPLYADTLEAMMAVVRRAIGKQWVPICWLREAIKDRSAGSAKRLVQSWLRWAHAQGDMVAKPENRTWLAQACFTHGITSGSGFANLVGVLEDSQNNHYETLVAAGYMPTVETIGSFRLKPCPGDRDVPVPLAWLVPCLQHPAFRETVGLPSLRLRATVHHRDNLVNVYLDAFWDENRALLQPLLPAVTVWAWQQKSPVIRDWLIDRASELGIWPQLTRLAVDYWTGTACGSWSMVAYRPRDQRLLEHLDRAAVCDWCLAAIDRELKNPKNRSLPYHLSTLTLIWLFTPVEQRPRLKRWLQNHLDNLHPGDVVDLITTLSLLDLPDNSPQLKRWLRHTAEEPNNEALATAAFALVNR